MKGVSMKKWWILWIAALLLVLTGCSRTEINCGVDEEMNAFLNIRFEAQWDHADTSLRGELENGCALLAKHYRDKLGFQVEESYTDTGCRLVLSMVRPAKTYAEAFEALEEMLSDEKLTPFVEVRTAHTAEASIEGYAMAVTMDAGSILDALGLELLPGDLQAFFRQGIGDSTAMLTLTLPGAPEGETGTSAAVSTEVDLGGETKLELSTLAVLENGVLTPDPRGGLEAELAARRKAVVISAVVLGAAALGLAVSLIFLLRKKRPAAEITPNCENSEKNTCNIDHDVL